MTQEPECQRRKNPKNLILPFHSLSAALEFQDIFRLHPTTKQVVHSKQISPKTASPVDIRLRPQTLEHVGRYIARHKIQRKRCRDRTLSDQIDRIRNLRVAEAHATYPPRFEAKVHAERIVDLYDPASLSQLAGKINILLPTVENQALVET